VVEGLHTTSTQLSVDRREVEGVRAEMPMVRWSGQRAASHCGVALITGCEGGAVREVHLTPTLFGEFRVGQEAHRRRQNKRSEASTSGGSNGRAECSCEE
jgi:hypothetical protein